MGACWSKRIKAESPLHTGQKVEGIKSFQFHFKI
ncbi:hypothetical protein BVRB_3g057360 [Beta vulgaris subsp. vulgaris]|nr:hypothetical protein BVRB_3g057360 [Beta vulgaris subsp. vulgaris]